MTLSLLLPAANPIRGDLLSSLLGGESLATTQIVVLLTAMTLLPAILVSLTPFLRLTVVLHFLRQALGTQSVPSNQVLLGLSLFLTIVIMQPVAADAYQRGWVPYQEHRLSSEQAWEEASRPIRTYLIRFCREKDLALIIEIAKTPAPKRPDALSLRILAPAYVLSELRASFQIGAVLFLPFLIIDLIVASLTLSIGMVQLPPAMISAPFKILLFVLVDGWNLIVGSLLRSVT
ncbi:MAG: flagellar type III secretion system pore protein FliP [Bryobacteraceae bacterium]